MALNMALGQAPQRIALEDLEIMIAQNNQEHQVLMMAIWAARRREEDQARGRERRPRRWWVKPWVSRRPLHGQYYHLFEELDRESEADYMSYVRIDRNLFAEILARIGPRIQKNQTGRTPIHPGQQLLITLRYMATGEGYRSSMRFNYRIPHNTISIIIRRVSKAIYREYRQEVWTVPSTPEGWKELAQGFSTRWNFHNCLGGYFYCKFVHS